MYQVILFHGYRPEKTTFEQAIQEAIRKFAAWQENQPPFVVMSHTITINPDNQAVILSVFYQSPFRRPNEVTDRFHQKKPPQRIPPG